MSRGPGKIERAIPRSIRRSRNRLGRVEVGVENIAEDVYGGYIDAALDAATDAALDADKTALDAAHDKLLHGKGRRAWNEAFDAAYNRGFDAVYANFPTKAQRVAILRAMHSFVRKHQTYTLAGGVGVTPLRIVRTVRPAGKPVQGRLSPPVLGTSTPK